MVVGGVSGTGAAECGPVAARWRLQGSPLAPAAPDAAVTRAAAAPLLTHIQAPAQRRRPALQSPAAALPSRTATPTLYILYIDVREAATAGGAGLCVSV